MSLRSEFSFRWFARVVVAVTIGAVLSLPSRAEDAPPPPPPPPPDERVTLRVEVPSSLATAPWDRATRVVFDEFVREHPEINVVPALGVALDAAGGSTGGSGGLLGIAGGVSPDVFSLFFARVHTFIDQRFVVPLDDYLGEYELADEIPPQLWPVVTDDDGKRYGAIYTWPTLYLVYRRDLFEQVGLDPDRPPRTWDELYEYAKRLSDPEMIVETAGSRKAGLGRMGLFLQTSGSWVFPNFVWQAGGEMVTKREDGKWEARFDSPEAIRALEFWKKLRWQEWERNGKTYKGVARVGYGLEFPEYALVFARGEVAMTMMPLRRLQNVLSLRIVPPAAIGVAPLPAGPTGIRASMVDGDAYCITSRFAGDRRKMDAAWKYIEFVTGKRAREIETRIYVEEGYGKFVRNPDWLKEFGYQEYYDEISPQHIAAFQEALSYGRPEPYCPDYDAMRPEIDLPISRILNNPNADPQQELTAAVKRINTHFFKLYPKALMRRRRKAGLVVAIVLTVLVSLVGYLLVKSISKRVSASKSGLQSALKASRWKHINAWLFLLPAVGTIAMWRYFPLLRGSVMSFYDYKLLATSTFIGLDNFIEAVAQPIFWKALFNTFHYAVLTMTLGFVTPIVLALLLSEIPRFKITFRMLYYLPALTSALVLMFLWKQLIFEPTAGGVLNQMLSVFGIPAQTWLNDSKLAMLCVVLPGVWAGAGPGSIIYLAALKTVPDELYEAAEIDGAGAFAKIRLVTLPYLKALIIINFFGAFIGSFHATQQIFVMTMGGPDRATHTLSMEIFFNAFLYLKLGYATAMAWIMGSLLVGFTLCQLRMFQRVQFTAGASKG